MSGETTRVITGGNGGSPGEPLIAVVCASNDPAVLDRMLLASLRRQTLRWELRVVDARAEGLPSCAAALNRGAAETRAPWLLFVHQDLAFDEPAFLERAIGVLTTLPDLGAAGPIGATVKPIAGRQRVVGALRMGTPPKPAGGMPIDRPTQVQTLDELMIFAPRAAFERVRFDEAACPDWHLYGVDYCLSCARVGLRAYAVPLDVHHLSGGTLNAGYYATLRRVAAKHRGHVSTISTTSEAWPIRLPSALLRPWHYAKVLARVTSATLGA